MSKITKNLSRNANTKKPAKKAIRKSALKSSGRKTPRYQQGKPALSISYNGIGNEFVFSLDQHGKIESKFHVDVQQILTIMGVPLVVSPI
tara:strand:+ start:529 stop:798 length:270 start_codon:yes stop_codon:yes gene_type:complete